MAVLRKLFYLVNLKSHQLVLSTSGAQRPDPTPWIPPSMLREFIFSFDFIFYFFGHLKMLPVVSKAMYIFRGKWLNSFHRSL